MAKAGTDAATRRARAFARAMDTKPRMTVEDIAKLIRQAEARVRRQVVATACNWAEERRRRGRPNERAVLLAFAQYVQKQPKVEGTTTRRRTTG
jgi:hypothetical protein